MSKVKFSPKVIIGQKKADEIVLVTIDGDEAFTKITGQYMQVWDAISEEGVEISSLMDKFPKEHHGKIQNFIDKLSEIELLEIED